MSTQSSDGTSPVRERLDRIGRALLDPSSYGLLTSYAFDRLVDPPLQTGHEDFPDFSDRELLAAAADRGVPRIIFQTWKVRAPLPVNYAYWRSTFCEHNRDHHVVLWDDADNRRFIATHFPWFLPTYDSYPREIFRADIVRPFFLFRYGGYYADMDSECVRGVAALATGADIILGRMGRDPSFEHSIPNAIMVSRPAQAFWLLMIAIAIERLRGTKPTDDIGPEYLTGPVLLRDAVGIYQSSQPDDIIKRITAHVPEDVTRAAQFGKIDLLPPSRMYTVNWNNPIHRLFRKKILESKQVLSGARAQSLFRRASIVTYWSHSW